MDRDKLVFVVVDVQEKLLGAIYNKEGVVRSCIQLMRLAEVLKIPVILTEQYPKGLGPTVKEVIKTYEEVETEKYKVEKTTFSCVREPAFTDILSSKHRQGRVQVVLCGIEAHICVCQTALDLKNYGYKVFVVSDGTGSRRREDHESILNYFLFKGVEVVPTETVIFSLLERAGTPEFKAMLPYVK